jgi:hypothetical protein
MDISLQNKLAQAGAGRSHYADPAMVHDCAAVIHQKKFCKHKQNFPNLGIC